MKRLVLALAVVCLLALALAQGAMATTVDTTEAGFLARIQKPGYFLEDFGEFQPGYLSTNSMGFAGNGFSYTIESAGGLYAVSGDGSPWSPTSDPTGPVGGGAISIVSGTDTLLVVNFAGNPNPVSAVGGYFFATNEAGAWQHGNVTVTFTDGSTTQQDVSGFLGFTTTSSTILTLAIDVTQDGGYVTLDHLYVGKVLDAPTTNAVPEPISMIFFGTGLVAVGGFVARRRMLKQA